MFKYVMFFLASISILGCSGENNDDGEGGESSSRLEGVSFILPLGNDFSVTPITFDVTLSGAEENNGTVTVMLDISMGIDASIATFNDLRILASAINAQLLTPESPQTQIGVFAEAVDLGEGNYNIVLLSVEESAMPAIVISNESNNASEIGLYSSLVYVPGE